MLALLDCAGLIEDRRDPRLADDGFAEREPALAALSSAAVTGNMPAGPEARQYTPIRLRSDGSSRSVSGLSARQCGFSLHAATTAPAHDVRARETLCKYVLRPPLAEQRVKKLPNGLVRVDLKRAFSDGTVAIDLDPLSLLCRLAAAVPPPRAHLVRYSGVLSAAHRWRERVVPPPPQAQADANDGQCEHGHPPPEVGAELEPLAKPATHRSRYRPWRELLKRTFQVDLEQCAKCGARLVLRALVTAAQSVARFLCRLGDDPDPPPIAPARPPPFFRLPALRRAAGDLDGTSAGRRSCSGRSIAAYGRAPGEGVRDELDGRGSHPGSRVEMRGLGCGSIRRAGFGSARRRGRAQEQALRADRVTYAHASPNCCAARALPM